MNRNQIKAATDAFLDELIEIRTTKAQDGIIPLPESYSIYIGGRWARIDMTNKENMEKMVTQLKAAIGKVYRKHIKQLMEGGKDE